MDYRTLGKTGLRVSALGFGCGNVGGLMIRGSPLERERAVARALELGINYFDTAASYGDGVSEQNLGLALKALGATPYVGTKFNLAAGERGDAGGAIRRSLEASLRRLSLERVDLLQLHERIVTDPGGRDRAVDLGLVLGEILPALEKLRSQSKLRFYGITALGDTEALHRALASGALDTAQVCLNVLNPSASVDVPPGFPAQDFRRLLSVARGHRVGSIIIRVAAAGALSGTETRHPIAVSSVEPIASGRDYATDVQRARTLGVLVEEGHVESLIEASLRFALTDEAVSTVLLGYSSVEQIEYAAAAVAKGPLPPSALTRLTGLWRRFTEGGVAV